MQPQQVRHMPSCNPQVLTVAFHLGRLLGMEQVVPVAAAVQCVLLLFRLQACWAVVQGRRRAPEQVPRQRFAKQHSVLPASPACSLGPQFFSRVFPATKFAFVEDIAQVLHDVSAVAARLCSARIARHACPCGAWHRQPWALPCLAAPCSQCPSR